MRPHAAAFALALIVLATTSCGGIVDPSKNQTDTFTGTLSVGSQQQHQFSASKTGEFTAKLTALTPTSTALVGMAIVFASNDGACSATSLQVNNFSSTLTSALGGQILSGKYCLVVYDVGTLQTAQTYTITLSHP